MNDPIVTKQEKAVLQLIAKGLKNKEIAEALFISTHTVKTHKSNLCYKLSLRSTNDLFRYALKYEEGMPALDTR